MVKASVIVPAYNGEKTILFSLIIPTFNSHDSLERLLSSLVFIKGELNQVEVIVVDDGSYDDTEEVALRFRNQFENISYVYQKNRGPAAARNLGAKNARGRYLIFVDDDCFFQRGCLQNIKNFHINNKDYAGFGIKTVNQSSSIFSEFNQRLGDYLIRASRTSNDTYGYVSSRCYSFSKESFLKINGHDEDFIWPAAEDRGLCLRMTKDGMRLTYLESKPLLNVDNLSLKGFIKQNIFYGLGAGLLMQKHPGISPTTASRYKNMILQICKDKNAFKGLALFLIFCLSQACSIAGVISYKINYDHKNRLPSSFLPRHGVLIETAKNFILGVPLVKSIKKLFGSLTTGEELYTAGYLASSAKKTYDIYTDIIHKASNNRNWFDGKRVLEIGPGSHLAVALFFIAEGVEKVVSIDKYGEVKFGGKEALVYEKILSQLSAHEKEIITPLLKELTLSRISSLDSSKLNYLPDTSIEGDKIAEMLLDEFFDLIISSNTLEHIRDLNAAFNNMRRLLKKGGILVHKVDAGSHSAVTRYTKNRLSHFMFSDIMFNMMFSRRDAPTRRVLDDYLKIMEEKNFCIIKCIVDEIATENEIKSSSRFLDPRYSDIPLKDLSKTGFIIVARKD